MNSNLEMIIKSKPVGLDRSVGRIISSHQGKEHGIRREEMLAKLHEQSHLKKTTDRHMRMSIEGFRKQGVRICHFETRKQDPVSKKIIINFWYYLAGTEEEYLEFRARYKGYADTIWKTTKAMDEQHPILNENGEVEPPKEIEIQGSLPLFY